MIVRLDKSYTKHRDYPNTNWTNESDVYVVDETTNEALADKIISLFPYYDFVLDDNRNLVDITPSEQPLDEIKKAKIAELNQACANSIVGGFTSTVDGTTYTFSYDQEAQSNLNGTASAFSRGYITEVVWTAYETSGNAVRLLLGSTTFDSVAKDALNHVNANISKFRDTLMPKVAAATAKEEVDAVVW